MNIKQKEFHLMGDIRIQTKNSLLGRNIDREHFQLSQEDKLIMNEFRSAEFTNCKLFTKDLLQFKLTILWLWNSEFNMKYLAFNNFWSLKLFLCFKCGVTDFSPLGDCIHMVGMIIFDDFTSLSFIEKMQELQGIQLGSDKIFDSKELKYLMGKPQLSSVFLVF